MKLLGIDTSNYTTSCALYDTEAGTILQRKQLLPVPEGQAGLRQSDAVFHHTKQLPELLAQLRADAAGALLPDAVGVSVRPRPAADSYMPCFLAGKAVAASVGSVLGVPVHETSHQMGHILAALYSAKALDWLEQPERPFLAFHVSGGTTDCVLCTPDAENVLQIQPVSGSLDLKAGQAIDRVGLMLGLQFPCGAELEKLAAQSDLKRHMHITLRDGNCSLSGLQNQCEKLLREGLPPEDIARYCMNTVSAAIREMTLSAAKRFGMPPVLYAGGVCSNGQIQREMQALSLQTAFAEPVFSCDNAAGTAVFAAGKEMGKWQS